MSIILDEKYKNKIIAVLKALFPDAAIYLYGSRARGTNSPRSDIDIALDAQKRLSHVDVMEAHDMLAESNIPYRMDIIDVHSVSERMQEAIKKDWVLWSR